MKAVILAAGRGKRMEHLTNDMPKPMLRYKGKNLIEHKLDTLPDEVDEVIMVVGYLENTIKNYFGDSYNNKKITYVQMEELTGTASALWLCKDLLKKEKFLVMMGDDLYDKNDVQLLAQEDLAILVKSSGEKEIIRGVLMDDNNFFVGLDPEKKRNAYTYTGLHVLDDRIFQYNLVKQDGKEEFGLPDTLASAAKDLKIRVLETYYWKQVTKPEDLK